jgi:hypothetical protein
MAEAEKAAGWRGPRGPLAYLILGATLVIEVAVLFSVGVTAPWAWAVLIAVLSARFGDRRIRTTIRGGSAAEAEAMARSFRTGVLPSDGSADAPVGWAVYVIRHEWRLLRWVQPWLGVIVAAGSLAVAVVAGEPLLLLVAAVSAGQAAYLRWDHARMDACFTGLERQIAARCRPGTTSADLGLTDPMDAL